MSRVVLSERGHDIIAMANEKNVLIGLTILCSFASGSIKNFHRLSRGWIFVDGFYLFKSREERRTEGRRARSRFVRCILSRRLNPPVDDTLFIVNRADLISRRFTTRPMFTVCNYIWCRNDRDAGKKIIDQTCPSSSFLFVKLFLARWFSCPASATLTIRWKIVMIQNN